MAEPLKAVKGMNDLLPPDSARWEWFEDKVRALMARYGYANVRTPIVEPTALFVRGLGEVTDIVEREMYSFEDAMNGDKLTLRPEATAGIVRAMVEHNALYNGPLRVWSSVALFRHERPQKGRYRQFHQIDVEALGLKGPDVDAEQILMCRALLRDLGLEVGRDVWLELNSLGQPTERMAHRAALIAHFEAHADLLDEDAKRRLHSNPLRILDTKNPAMQALVDAAPKLLDFLGEASLAHFEGLKKLLSAAGVEFTLNPRLVRGLDYYNLTVFEWITDALGAQGTVCGGGRYDGLFEQLGGKPAPGVGFAMGCERLVALMKDSGSASCALKPDAYMLHQGEGAQGYAFALADALRTAGHSVVLHAGGGSFKSQMKKADASGARLALITGEDEVRAQEISVKALRKNESQQRISRQGLLEGFAAILQQNKA